jgi:large subunit ribosomal protein L24
VQTTKPVTKPSKQRKMLFQAPAHLRRKFLAAPLSSELKASRGVKTLPVRSGDTVRIVRGDHKGFEGKISSVNRKQYRIYVEGLTREKVDGTTIFVAIHPSKVVLTNLNLDDKWRKQRLDEKKKAAMKAEEAAEKPPKKKVAEAKPEIEAVKPLEEKLRRRKKAPKKAEKKAEEVPEEKPKVKKPRARRKRAEKTEGGA